MCWLVKHCDLNDGTYCSHLTFMGPYIINTFQYISNKMQLFTFYLYLETALHVSGGTSTHHQERIQLYLQHLLCVTPSATCRYRGGFGTSSNSSTIVAGSSNSVTNTRCCTYSCMRSLWWVEVPPETCRVVSRYK